LFLNQNLCRLIKAVEIIMRIKTLLASSIIALGLCSGANAYTPIELPQLNTNIENWSDGSRYNPYFPSESQLGGVPFTLIQDDAGNNSFIGTLTIPIGIFGVSTVYTLMNTATGQLGAQVGTLTAIGSSGAIQSFALVVGDNIRDHYYGNYVNTISSNYVTLNVAGGSQPGTAHLDMQAFALNSEFAQQTLTSITFSGAGGNPQGVPFIAGLTVSAVPEPHSLLMWLAGILLFAYRAKVSK
jgi:hypothetical protein